MLMQCVLYCRNWRAMLLVINNEENNLLWCCWLGDGNDIWLVRTVAAISRSFCLVWGGGLTWNYSRKVDQLINKHQCATDQELALAKRFVFNTLTRWQQFSAWNDVMATILKIWCNQKSYLSIDTDVLKQLSCQISPRSVLKPRSLRVFAPTRTSTTRTRWVAIDQFLA